jgi:hypothetical protein
MKKFRHMKKLLLISTVILATSLGLSAQNKEGVGFGPRVGMNLSNIANGEFESWEDATNHMNIGAVVGLVVNIPFGKYMSFQPEFLFAQKGARLTREDGIFKDSYVAFINNYLEIPLLAKARLGGKFYGILEAGPYAGFWLNGKWKSQLVTNGDKGDIEKEKYEFRDEYVIGLSGTMEKDQRIDAGLAVGAGFGFGAGKGNVEFGLRYNMGFVDRIKYENGRPDGVNKQMNRNFGLAASFLF